MKAVMILFALIVVLNSLPVFAGGFGVQANWNRFETSESGLFGFGRDNSDFGIGARAELGGNWHLILSIDYYFVGQSEGILPVPVDTNFFEVNGNIAYAFGVIVRPYAGGGVGVARASFTTDFSEFTKDSESELGLNLLGGVKFDAALISPFVEFRYVLYTGDETFADRYVLTMGIVF